MESSLFAQSASIDKLLHMMRTIDTQSENVAENEELLVRSIILLLSLTLTSLAFNRNYINKVWH